MPKERPPLEEMTLRQLRKVASEYGISRYSRMRKSQLLAEIQTVERNRFSESQSGAQEAQEQVEAAKFQLGQQEPTMIADLSSIDEGLAELPGGYGESCIVLMPRDPQWAYAYWDIANDYKEELRHQGGQQLALRLYDVTDINLDHQTPHSIQEYVCDEVAREWYVPIPVSDRDYVVEIGYRTADGRWLLLARSAVVRVPPVYPSDWIEEQFITVSWEEQLQGKTFLELDTSERVARVPAYAMSWNEEIEEQRASGSLQAVSSYEQAVSSYAVSSYEQAVSSYAVSSYEQAVSSYTVSSYAISSYAASSYAVSSYERAISSFSISSYETALSSYSIPTSSYAVSSYETAVSSYALSSYAVSSYETALSSYGLSSYAIPVSSYETALSSYGLSSYAIPVSSYETALSSYSLSSYAVSSYETALSSYSLSSYAVSSYALSSHEMASMPPVEPRKFWLIADAELIVYGATEPDATVTIGGRPIKLNPDGTFRFQISFQDGLVDYPIMAVAADGQQTRSIHMKFNRETPSRHTNTKEEAVEEWLV